MSNLSYFEIMNQACVTAETYMLRALGAVAKAQAEGYEIADTSAVVAAFMAAAASDYAIHAHMKSAEENPGHLIRP
jgi:hypothetical protein